MECLQRLRRRPSRHQPCHTATLSSVQWRSHQPPNIQYQLGSCLPMMCAHRFTAWQRPTSIQLWEGGSVRLLGKAHTSSTTRLWTVLKALEMHKDPAMETSRRTGTDGKPGGMKTYLSSRYACPEDIMSNLDRWPDRHSILLAS